MIDLLFALFVLYKVALVSSTRGENSKPEKSFAYCRNLTIQVYKGVSYFTVKAI